MLTDSHVITKDHHHLQGLCKLGNSLLASSFLTTVSRFEFQSRARIYRDEILSWIELSFKKLFPMRRKPRRTFKKFRLNYLSQCIFCKKSFPVQTNEFVANFSKSSCCAKKKFATLNNAKVNDSCEEPLMFQLQFQLFVGIWQCFKCVLMIMQGMTF